MNYVTEHFIGRVGATLVVRGNPFSNTEYSSPLVYVDTNRADTDRNDLAEAAHDLSPVWTSPQDRLDRTETIQFPYDSSTSTLHTPVRSDAEKHMGDLGTPVSADSSSTMFHCHTFPIFSDFVLSFAVFTLLGSRSRRRDHPLLLTWTHTLRYVPHSTYDLT